MILIDTSIWINIFRDKTQRYSQHFYDFIGEQEIANPLPAIGIIARLPGRARMGLIK